MILFSMSQSIRQNDHNKIIKSYSDFDYNKIFIKINLNADEFRVCWALALFFFFFFFLIICSNSNISLIFFFFSEVR